MHHNTTLSWPLIQHELLAPLTVIAGRTQLLERQALRGAGMTTLEREQLVGNVAAVLSAVRILEARIGSLVPPGGSLTGAPDAAEPGAPQSLD